MRKAKHIILLVTLALGLVLSVFSQNHGVQWIQGPVPMAVMDFRNDSIQFHHINDTLPAFIGTANICDKEGNFLFFTNGVYVRDRNGNMMQNGDSLCYAAEWYNAFNSPYITTYRTGLPSDQSVLVLPKPGNENQYYIFHYLTIDTSYLKFNMVNTAPLVLYYTLVDMSANFGLGAVIEKNVRLPIYQPMCSSRMTAVKHANGRDWWLIRHGDRDSTYIKFLVTTNGINGPYFQKTGPPFNSSGGVQDYRGASVFNLDGSRMATANSWGPIVVLDFDRCSGEFSQPVTIKNKLYDTTIIGASSLALSPNGRFLYAHNIYELNQYDLWSSNINDSVRLYTIDSTDPYWLGTMALGPDNKIYISKWNGGSYALHVINYPDSLGPACGFEFNGQLCITANTVNLPNMVNYKLGALAGSGCDTIINGLPPNLQSSLNSKLQVWPNPFSAGLSLTLSEGEEIIPAATFTIITITGQVVYQQQESNLATGHTKMLDLSYLPNGVYFVEVSTAAGKAVQRVVKE